MCDGISLRFNSSFFFLIGRGGRREGRGERIGERRGKYRVRFKNFFVNVELKNKYQKPIPAEWKENKIYLEVEAPFSMCALAFPASLPSVRMLLTNVSIFSHLLPKGLRDLWFAETHLP